MEMDAKKCEHCGDETGTCTCEAATPATPEAMGDDMATDDQEMTS